MTRTFIDSGVLIAAARGIDSRSAAAMSVLDDPDREFASSIFVELEVLPKAVYNKQSDEAEFYRTYLSNVTYMPSDLPSMLNQAMDVAKRFGLSALDALHVAAAIAVGAEEIVTTELPTKPIYRVTELRVTSLSSLISNSDD